MGIYQRDNINYGGMLGNAMANRMAYAQRDADIQRQMGQNWGNALNQGAQGIAAGLNTWNQQRIDQDKLAQQQQFQAEQKALERANELKRAQEQQRWQAEQNALQRESTENIAALNRQSSLDERNAEKQAQAIMHYDIQKGNLDSIAQQIWDTDPKDSAKLAQLYRQRDEALAKLNYYAGLVPESYRGQRYGDSFDGFKIGMGEWQPTANQPLVTKQEQGNAGNTGTDNDVLAGLDADLKNAKTSADVQNILSKATDLKFADKSKLNPFISNAQSKLAELKKSEAIAAQVKNWKPGSPIPAGYRINFVNGQPNGLKKK